MADVSLEKSGERVEAAREAGNAYTTEMEGIRDTITKSDSSGTTLGTMVASQLQITEAETMYQVRQGLPNNVSKAVKAAAQAVKQAAG
ncbi:hypothetical protein EBR96_03005 [bacterium]|nr:hypothetical protein [bacterium]